GTRHVKEDVPPRHRSGRLRSRAINVSSHGRHSMKRIGCIFTALGAAVSLSSVAVANDGGEIENSGNAALLGSAIANDDSTATVETINVDNSTTDYSFDATDGSNNAENNTATSANGSASAAEDSTAIGVTDSGNGNFNTTLADSFNAN